MFVFFILNIYIHKHENHPVTVVGHPNKELHKASNSPVRINTLDIDVRPKGICWHCNEKM